LQRSRRSSVNSAVIRDKEPEGEIMLEKEKAEEFKVKDTEKNVSINLDSVQTTINCKEYIDSPRQSTTSNSEASYNKEHMDYLFKFL
jgi:hypothetical protein